MTRPIVDPGKASNPPGPCRLRAGSVGLSSPENNLVESYHSTVTAEPPQMIQLGTKSGLVQQLADGTEVLRSFTQLPDELDGTARAHRTEVCLVGD